jgi:hypothetical protein
MSMTSYQQRQNEANLAVQAPAVKKIVKELLEELKRIEGALYWALDPSETDGGQQWASSAIDHAHALLDAAHEYRAALKADPPPQESDDDT